VPEGGSLAHLSEKQKRAYDLMCKGENIFLTGPGGTGKTHLLKLFSHEKKLYKNVGITSTTGVSALLINGTTLHSFLGINLGKEDAAMLYMRIKKKSYIVKRWKELDVLIIDEISMLSPVLFEKLESIARLIRKNEKPFGGIQLILTGDFLQLPNVDMPNAFCFEAESWNICVPNIVYLTDIFRQDDDGFKTILNEARIDELSDESIKILKSRENVELTNEAGIVPTKIYSLNVDVNRENEEALDRLVVENENLEFYEYKRIHMLMKKDLKFYDEKLNKFSSCVENLQICVGAQVMLTINLDLDGGLVNGSRGIVESFEDGMPVVKFLNGVSAFIDYHEWIIEENGVNLMCITQIPLKVAYAVTIHKCQGMTLDCAEIDFNGIFEKSQGYVALSRVKTLGGLTIKNFDESKIFVNPKAKNFYEKLNNI
jgi:ATP-dependent DNA helicase PIF1